MAVAALGTVELEHRILAFLGPRTALLGRQVCRTLAQSWETEHVSSTSRNGAWASCVGSLGSMSMHTLLEPFSRRVAGSGGKYPTTAAMASKAESHLLGLFDAAFVLLSQRPSAAAEPQVRGRLDEECAVVENMERSPLIVAARCGLVGIAWLIARHCTAESGGLNQKDSMGCTALRYAIVSKDERMCRCLLSFPSLDLEMPDARGDSALLQAVGANAPAICRLLLERRADVSFTNRGHTALDVAEELGYEECARALRSCGAPCGSGRARGTEAAWSDEDDDLDGSGDEPDPELLFALRESRRMAAAGGICSRDRAASQTWESDGDHDTSERDCKRARRRWDNGGLVQHRCFPRPWQG